MDISFYYSIFSLLYIGTECTKTTYQFEVVVSNIPWSGTVDEIYFRLCNTNDVCGMFITVPDGWPSRGETYSYTYTINIDIGDIYKVQIVHPGSDILCIDHIKVNGIQYDDNESDWWGGAHCIEEPDGGGCDTVTIILPHNNWTSVLTIPCKFKQDLNKTYAQTSEPTILTKNPTIFPTKSPTNYPTFSSTINALTTDMPFHFKDNNVQSWHGIIIGGIIIFGLMLLISIILLLYCWRKNRNMKEGIKDINGESDESDEESSIELEGVVKTVPKSVEREQLISNEVSKDSSTDDDSIEQLYNNSRRNTYKSTLGKDD